MPLENDPAFTKIQNFISTISSFQNNNESVFINASASGVINGTEANETINGSHLAITVNACDGDDIVMGSSADDSITGGEAMTPSVPVRVQI